MFSRSVRRWAIALGVSVAALTGAYAGVLVATNNFHELVPGEVYRSAQPSPADLRAIEATYGVASVLNLRGASAGKGWYDAEAAAARAAGVTLIDFRMSASSELTPVEVERLIQTMRDAPKPLLIHCRSGADRTGAASALYLAAIKHADEETAEWQLSPLYGHIATWGLPSFAMDRMWETAEPSLGFHDS